MKSEKHQSKQSDHYPSHLELKRVESKAVLDRMHRFVNMGKALFKRGACSNGRTFNLCFVVRKSKIIAIGLNDYHRQMIGYDRRLKTTYKKKGEKSYIPSMHAETSAILKLGIYDCSDLAFYNVRIDKNMHCSCSQPCSNCLRILKMFHAKHIYCYSDDMSICEVISFS